LPIKKERKQNLKKYPAISILTALSLLPIVKARHASISRDENGTGIGYRYQNGT
jgi:hypothetical protein